MATIIYRDKAYKLEYDMMYFSKDKYWIDRKTRTKGAVHGNVSYTTGNIKDSELILNIIK
jgi:hypothetical protein